MADTETKPATKDESVKERLDRELVELLQEMRVMLPGIQVIFGFLMTVPFTPRFADLNDHLRAVYFGVFLTTTVATSLLVAPTAFHRLRWRRRDKEVLLQLGNRLSIAGLAFFALSITGICFIVSEMVVSTTVAFVVALCVSAVVLLLWFGMPILREAQDDEG